MVIGGETGEGLEVQYLPSVAQRVNMFSYPFSFSRVFLCGKVDKK